MNVHTDLDPNLFFMQVGRKFLSNHLKYKLSSSMLSSEFNSDFTAAMTLSSFSLVLPLRHKGQNLNSPRDPNSI